MWNVGSAAGVVILPDKLVFATVAKGLQGFSLKRVGEIENHHELGAPELRNRIRQLTEGNGFSRENLIVGLPCEQVIARVVELPLDVEENLEQVVRFQVDRFEPSEEERSYYDYVVLSRDEAQKKLVLQVVMVRQSILDGYLNLLTEVGLYPAAVRVSSIGLHQVFAFHADGYPKKEPWLVLDMNPGSMEMVLIEGPERFSAERAALDGEQADVNSVIREVYGFLSRLHLRYEALGRIYLAGTLGRALLADFRQRFTDCELLTEKLGIRDKSQARSTPDSVQAIGLAASALSRTRSVRLNLIPPAKRRIGRRASFIPTVVLLLLVVVMGGIALTRDYFQSAQLLAQLQTEVSHLRPQVDEVMALRKQTEERDAELAELRGLMKGEQKVLNVLKELSERLPDDTYLQNLNIEKGQAAMFGYSESASALIPMLKASPHFKSVSSRFITKDQATKKDKFNFDVVLRD